MLMPVTIHFSFPHELFYVDCLYHLHCWNTETDVNPNYSIYFLNKIPAIAVQELVNANGTNFCEDDAHFHPIPVVRSYLSF